MCGKKCVGKLDFDDHPGAVGHVVRVERRFERDI